MEPLPLKKSRLLAGFSQQEVANKLGVSQPTYQRWESGATPIPPAKLNKLAKLLGVRVNILEGKPELFDYLGYNTKFEDDRRYFGEVAIHFAGGGEPLLLSISIDQRDSLAEQLMEGENFPLISSLDNRTVVFRLAAVSDIFFSSEAYDDFGPEHATYDGGLGIFPDDEFWEIVEQLEGLDDASKYSKERFDEVLASVELSDEQLDELVRTGEIPDEERAKVREDADKRYLRFQTQAIDLSWQLSSGKKRNIYVEHDRDIFSLLSEAQMTDFEQLDMLCVPAEGYHRSVFINPLSIDYLTGPTHRFRRGLVGERERTIDKADS